MLREGSRVAVVGAGISGVTAAYILQKRYQVTLFESEPELGGHAHTVFVNDPDLGQIGIDMGFIVLNDRNYPKFTRLLNELEVPTQESEMSFGFFCEESGFTYSGRSLGSLFADRSNLFNWRFYLFLRNLLRFSKSALRALEHNSVGTLTLGEYLSRESVSPQLIRNYIAPMGAAIWSCAEEGVLNYPAQAFLSFFKHHGLLDLSDRPTWRTVVGGSRSYLRQFEKKFHGQIRLGTRILKISRKAHPVIHTEAGEESFDAVVMATHAPTTLRLLEEPSELERTVLAPWRYTENRVTLHTDSSFLPNNKRAWASWNYRRRTGVESELPTVTYWMNNLQSLETNRTYCVTLNELPATDSVIKSLTFEHPLYTSDALASQVRLHELQGINHSYFCGAYFGYGFHEDGCRSGSSAAAALGVTW